MPTSLASHLADIWLEELENVLSDETIVRPYSPLLPSHRPAAHLPPRLSAPSQPPAPLSLLLSPFTSLLTSTPHTTTYNRLLLSLYTPLLTLLTPSLATSAPKRARRDPEDPAPYPSILANCAAAPGGGREDREEVAQSVLKGLVGRASNGGETGVREVNRRRVYEFVRAWGGGG